MGNTRIPFIESDVVASGVPNLRTPLIFTEDVITGVPSLRVNLIFSSVLTNAGADNLRTSFLNNEVLANDLPDHLRVVLVFNEVLTSRWETPPLSTQIFPGSAGSGVTLPGLSWSIHKKPTFSTRISKQQVGKEVRSADYPMPLWEFNLTFDYLPDDEGNYDLDTNLKTLLGFFLQMNGSFGTFLLQDPTDYAVLGGLQWTGDGTTTRFPIVRNLGGFNETIGQLNQQEIGTFPAAAVNIGTGVINIPNHGLKTADGPVAFANTGTLPAPLAATSTYWVIVVDANNVQLATSRAAALANSAMTLTSAGTGNNAMSRDIALYSNGTLLDKTSYSITGANNYITFNTAPAAGVQITADFWFWFNLRFLDDVHDYEQFALNLWQLQKCDLMSVIQ